MFILFVIGMMLLFAGLVISAFGIAGFLDAVDKNGKATFIYKFCWVLLLVGIPLIIPYLVSV